ncbi:DUF192 domain-containing protein [Candidatus Pacearchaeota archaeon]|nr:DUF192 domain-containing protein [Candidatus Pacearchaeota archaeon]
MKIKIIYISIIFFVIGTITLFLLTENKMPKVCFENSCFEVEIVDDDLERTRGLMFRENLANNMGMLFIFEKLGVYPFWMKNTILSLDIIWINSEFEVVHIEKETVPQSLSNLNPKVEAKYVLEINAGLSIDKNIEIGSIAKFRGI